MKKANDLGKDSIGKLLLRMSLPAILAQLVNVLYSIVDQPERQMVAEIVREKALRYLQDEVPHGIAVEVETFDESEREKLVRIGVAIFCEKASHKGIIIGKQGAMLKKIASAARHDMEELLDCKVFLECFVKVREWRNQDSMLRNFGYTRDK